MTASAPRAWRRLRRTRLPPWASAIWRARTRPMPEPAGLVVKKGTKRLVASATPGPSSSTRMVMVSPERDQERRTPSRGEAAAWEAAEEEEGEEEEVVVVSGSGS